MKQNCCIWTNRNLDKLSAHELDVLAFIRTIESSDSQFNFNYYAEKLTALPELLTCNHSQTELNDQSRHFFYELDLLSASQPLQALKLITLLACNSDCTLYTTIFGQNVLHRLADCLLDVNIPQKVRIEWGLHCWKEWPVKFSRFEKNIFISPLMTLFVSEATDNPGYIQDTIALLRERNSIPDYVFNRFAEDPEQTLRLARLLQKNSPAFFIASLVRCLQEGRKEFRGYKPTEEVLRGLAFELFNVSEVEEYACVSDQEYICQELIRYAYPDEPWYPGLLQKLYSLESNKPGEDKHTIQNHCLIAMNAIDGSPAYKPAISRIRQWALRHETLDLEDHASFLDHAKKLIELINEALNEKYPRTRNFSTPAPLKCMLTDIAVDAYWKMAEWLFVRNRKNYFFVLIAGLEMPTFTAQATRDLGEQAKEFFIAHFEYFAKDNVHDGTSILVYMIERTGYSDIKFNLREVLDNVYWPFFAIDEEAARYALDTGLKKETEYFHIWRPKRLK